MLLSCVGSKPVAVYGAAAPLKVGVEGQVTVTFGCTTDGRRTLLWLTFAPLCATAVAPAGCETRAFSVPATSRIDGASADGNCSAVALAKNVRPFAARYELMCVCSEDSTWATLPVNWR